MAFQAIQCFKQLDPPDERGVEAAQQVLDALKQHLAPAPTRTAYTGGGVLPNSCTAAVQTICPHRRWIASSDADARGWRRRRGRHWKASSQARKRPKKIPQPPEFQCQAQTYWTGTGYQESSSWYGTLPAPSETTPFDNKVAATSSGILSAGISKLSMQIWWQHFSSCFSGLQTSKWTVQVKKKILEVALSLTGADEEDIEVPGLQLAVRDIPWYSVQ